MVSYHLVNIDTGNGSKTITGNNADISRVSRQKGPTRHGYAWQIGPFWQDTLDIINWTGMGV